MAKILVTFITNNFKKQKNTDMNILKFMWKALLIVVLPFAFLVVATTIVNFLLAVIGNFAGVGTISQCFYGLFDTGITTFIIGVFTIIGTVYYLSNEA